MKIVEQIKAMDACSIEAAIKNQHVAFTWVDSLKDVATKAL